MNNVSIKIGKIRINIDKVAYVSERTSEKLCKNQNGWWWEDFYDTRREEHVTAAIATVTYAVTYSGPEGGSDMSHTFYAEEADEFLRLYDLYTAAIIYGPK